MQASRLQILHQKSVQARCTTSFLSAYTFESGTRMMRKELYADRCITSSQKVRWQVPWFAGAVVCGRAAEATTLTFNAEDVVAAPPAPHATAPDQQFFRMRARKPIGPADVLEHRQARRFSIDKKLQGSHALDEVRGAV